MCSSDLPAAEVVRRLGAVQAQDYGNAKWGVARRTRGGGVDVVVESAVNQGSILRTHVLRPTWHFVAPADIRWMLALRDGNELTRAELAQVFRRARVDATGSQRLGHLLMRAELEGIVCRAWPRA